MLGAMPNHVALRLCNDDDYGDMIITCAVDDDAGSDSSAVCVHPRHPPCAVVVCLHPGSRHTARGHNLQRVDPPTVPIR